MLLWFARTATNTTMTNKKRKEEEEVQLHVRVPKSLVDQLKEHAKFGDVSISHLARAALNEKAAALTAAREKVLGLAASSR